MLLKHPDQWLKAECCTFDTWKMRIGHQVAHAYRRVAYNAQ